MLVKEPICQAGLSMLPQVFIVPLTPTARSLIQLESWKSQGIPSEKIWTSLSVQFAYILERDYCIASQAMCSDFDLGYMRKLSLALADDMMPAINIGKLLFQKLGNLDVFLEVKAANWRLQIKAEPFPF